MQVNFVNYVLTVVCKLVSEPSVSNGIRVDDGSTTTSHHGPYTPSRVKDGELEGRSGLSIQVTDVGLFGELSAPEGSGEVCVAPM